MDEAAVNCDRICIIDGGKIRAVGAPRELFLRKRSEELGIQRPRITRFSSALKTELKKIYPGIEFKRRYFDPAKEAAAVVDTVVKAGGAGVQ